MEPLNIFDTQNVDDICCICLNIMDNEILTHKITECNHKFHSGCLIQWLRTSKQCPMCRNESNNFYRRKTSLFRVIVDFLRRKKDKNNKKLQTIYRNYKNIKNNYEKENKSLKEFRNKNKNLLKEYIQIKNKKRRLHWHLIRSKRQIENLPIVPILIKN
jgi:hypothetical protein